MKVRALIPILAVAAAYGCGCGSQVETSADYQKLPPGEGQRRLQDTLKRRAAGQHLDHPYGADVRVPDSTQK